MASYTPNLNLYKKDPIADGNDFFNIKTMMNDNWDKIDDSVKAALDDIEDLQSEQVRIATGSYVGTGTYGASNPCSLTFDFVPKFLLLSVEHEIEIYPIITFPPFMAGQEKAAPMTSGTWPLFGELIHLNFSNKTVSWYGSSDAPQGNTEGRKYYWVAIG